MLEEDLSTTMEKKSNNRPSSVPPKTNGNDYKKSDNGNGKPQFSRGNGRRRDYGKSYQESSPRRPTPQKNRVTVDKRPRSRGGYQYPNRTREDVVEEYRADYDSVLTPGSRKTNLNHLLNFSYQQRDTQSDRSTWYRGNYRGGRRRYSSRTSYNKEQYLQANCQFVVQEDGDYSIHSIDPDILVDWSKIELVKVQSHENTSCPICLQVPTAAKMTRCGHIYCWSCILHYLSLDDKSWRKCPICYESIHQSDLKSVVTKVVHSYKVGESITMRLMKKERGKTYAVPKSLWEKSERIYHNINDNEEKVAYVKLLTATKENIKTQIIDKEKAALQQQLQDAEVSEVAFIDSAIHLLMERETELIDRKEKRGSSKRTVSQSSSGEENLVKETPPQKTAVKSVASKVYASAFSDEEEEIKDCTAAESPEPQEEPQQETPSRESASSPTLEAAGGSPSDPPMPVPVDIPPDAAIPVEEAAEYLEMPMSTDNQPSKNRKEVPHDSFYFYQAADGQQIYLHAVNARCLVKEYGSLELCPDTITANIVEMETIFMSEELRKRLRYLAHLPLTSEFEVAELELKPPIVSKETLKFYSNDIEHRKRLRQKKLRQEKIWSRKIQEEEKKQMGINPGLKIVRSQFLPHVMSEHRPTSPATKSDDSPLSTPSVTSPVGSPETNLASSVEDDDGQQTSMSFAQMLKKGETKTPIWPKVNSKTETAPRTRSASDRRSGSEESDNEEKVPVPVFQNSFGDAIQAAFDSLAKGQDVSRDTATSNMVKLPGKKKKKQQKLLFATSMARGGK